MNREYSSDVKVIEEVHPVIDLDDDEVVDSSLPVNSDISHNKEFMAAYSKFRKSINKVDKMLKTLLSGNIYDRLSVEDKVKYDLFVAFAINSLYWSYLKTKGRNPATTLLKNEITRVKNAFDRLKKIQERKTIMPRLNKDAAKRFIRSGLWEPKE